MGELFKALALYGKGVMVPFSPSGEKVAQRAG